MQNNLSLSPSYIIYTLCPDGSLSKLKPLFALLCQAASLETSPQRWTEVSLPGPNLGKGQIYNNVMNTHFSFGCTDTGADGVRKAFSFFFFFSQPKLISTLTLNSFNVSSFALQRLAALTRVCALVLFSFCSEPNMTHHENKRVL